MYFKFRSDMKRNAYIKPVCAVEKLSSTPLLAAVSSTQSIKIGDPYKPESDENAPYTLTDADGKWWVAE